MLAIGALYSYRLEYFKVVGLMSSRGCSGDSVLCSMIGSIWWMISLWEFSLESRLLSVLWRTLMMGGLETLLGALVLEGALTGSFEMIFSYFTNSLK